MTEISDLTTSCRFQNTLDKDIPKIEPATEADKRFDDKTQRFDNVEQFTADAAGICKKRQRRHDRTRRPSVSPIKPVRLKIQRGSKGNVIEGPQVVAKTRQTHQDADLSNIKTASAINADVKWLESQTICNSEKLTAEWVSVAEFHRLNKLGNTESEYTGNTESETGNKKSETLTLVDQPKPLGSGRVKSYVEKINSDIHSKEKEIQGNIKDKIKDTVNNYLETAIDRTPKKVKKQYYLGPKPFKSQNSIDRCGPSLQYEKSETTVIDHITEQSIANRDELVVKSKSETKFVDLSDQFGLDEHTLSTAKNNVLNSKLVNYLDKEPDKDKVEILSNYDHDLPVRLEDNLDTAEADSPETNSQTFPFKVEAENRTESSVNDKNDCELMSQTVVKPRSDETENNFAETVRYAAPQHANESYESNGSKELTGSRLYGGNSAYLNSFIRKNHGKHRKEGIKLSSIGTLNSEKTVKHSGDFAFTNPENNVKSIYTHSDATDIKTDTVKDILNRENKRSFLENLGPFLDNNGKLSDVEINCDSQSGPAIVGMFQDNQVTSLKHDLEPHTLGDEWRSGGQIENVHVSEAERNREKIVKDDRDFSTTEIKQTPNHDWQGARPKGKQ